MGSFRLTYLLGQFILIFNKLYYFFSGNNNASRNR